MSFMNLLQSGLSSLAQNGMNQQMMNNGMNNQMMNQQMMNQPMNNGMMNNQMMNQPMNQMNGGGGLSNLLGGFVNAAGGKGNLAALVGIGGLGALLTSGLDKSTARGIGLLGTGALAYSLYQKYKGQNPQNQMPNQMNGYQNQMPNGYQNAPQMPNQMPNQVGYQNAPQQVAYQSGMLSKEQELIIKAVVFAVRADGMIDANERQCVNDLIAKILPNMDASSVVSAFLNEPIDPRALSSQITSKEQAGEIYALSCMVIDIDHELERGYLDALSSEFGLSKDEASAIENEIANSKSQMKAQFA